MDNIYAASGTAALVASTLMQIVKNSPLVPWINRETGRLNAVLSIVVAGLMAFGIQSSFNYDGATGAFAIGFSGTVTGLLHSIGHWVAQWAAQHGMYKGFIAPAEILGEMRAIQKLGLLGQQPNVQHEEPPTLRP